MLNKNMKRKMSTGCAIVVAMALILAGCASDGTTVTTDSVSVSTSAGSVDISNVTATVTLSDSGSTYDGEGVEIDGTDVIITSGGTFSFTGTLTEGRIKVEAENKDVTIVLNGVNITNSEKDAIYIESANSAVIYVCEGTENVLTSGTEDMYTLAKESASESNDSATTGEEQPENSQETGGEVQSESAQGSGGEEQKDSAQGSDGEVQPESAQETDGEAQPDSVQKADSEQNTEDTTETDNAKEESSVDASSTDESGTETTDDGFDNSQKATIMAKCDLTITGAGSLSVNGYINNAVQSKTVLSIDSVDLTVTTSNDGIKAGTAMTLLSGTYNITSVGDAIQSDGDLTIENGDYTIVTGDGAASVAKKTENMRGGQGGRQGMPNGQRPGQNGQAPQDGQAPDQNGAAPQDGQAPEQNGQAPQDNQSSEQNGMEPQNTQNMTPPSAPENMGGKGFAGGPGQMENSSDLDDTNSVSQKGIKAAGTLSINGGTFSFDTADDAIHAASTLTINDGTMTISSGDDGVHCDTDLVINGGVITVTDCYEGIEGTTITVNGGETNVTSSDDGFNASSDVTDPEIVINDGYVYVNSQGDGIDSNKNITINGGTVYVDGPSEAMNAAIDFGSENQGIFVVNGGTVTALGSSGMFENASDSSTQQIITYIFDSTVETGTTITITDSDGKEVDSFTTTKSVNMVTYSSAQLTSGQTYTITAGDQSGQITASSINATN